EDKNITHQDVEHIKKFQQEFHEIFSLLIKEKSHTKIKEEILNKAVNSSKSILGLLILIEENRFSFEYYAGSNIDIEEEMNRGIRDNLNYIQRWLTVNKKALLIENNRANIGFHLTETLNCKYLIILPCFLEDLLIGTVILGRENTAYTDQEAPILERLATLLAFA